MKTTIAVLALLLLSVGTVHAQDEQFPGLFTYSQTAVVLPHLSLFVAGETGVMNSGLRVFRGNARIGLAGAFELGISQQDESIDFLGQPHLRINVHAKLRLLEGSRSLPAVALSYRTAFGWEKQILWHQNLQHTRPDFVLRGLNGARFENQLSTLELIVTQPLGLGASVSVGAGLQEFQYRGVWVFMDPAPYATNGLVAWEQQQRLLLTGFVHAYVPITNAVNLVAQAQTLPATSPVLNQAAIQIDRVYVAALGVRYVPLNLFAVDATIVYNSAYLGISNTEARLGVSAFINTLHLDLAP